MCGGFWGFEDYRTPQLSTVPRSDPTPDGAGNFDGDFLSIHISKVNMISQLCLDVSSNAGKRHSRSAGCLFH